MTNYEDLIRRLRSLVIMDEVGSDNPLGHEAAAAIKALVEERDHWKDYSRSQGAVLTSGVVVPTEEYRALIERAERAEADLAAAQEALRDTSTMLDVYDAREWLDKHAPAIAAARAEGGE